MSDQDERWQRVGRAVSERMLQLGYSQADLARRTGLSAITIRPFMHGLPSNSRPATTARIARELGWPPDAIPRILGGEDPSGFDDPPPGAPAGALPADEPVALAALVGQLPPEKRAAIEQLVRTMLADEDPESP